MGNLSNLSNIELFNNKYLDRTPIIPTLPNDQAIVERVEVDMTAILEHAVVLYKHYGGARANGSVSGYAKGWRPYSYNCKHCDANVTRSLDMFIKHLDLCEGLDD